MAKVHINLRGQSLIGRVLLGTAALAVVVLLFFFLAAALVVGAIVGTAVLARLWWLNRRLKRAPQPEVITTEYTVIKREPPKQPRLPEEIGTDPSKERQ